jgi:uncharacterized protein (TIGR02145 family)
MVIVEQTILPTPIRLSQAEYFWDTDPGEGNGTILLATDGNFDSVFERLFATGISIAQPMGLHVFNIRIKDNVGVWSPVFKNAIYIETTLCNTPQPTALTTQYICNSGTVANLVATGTTIKWYSNNTIGTSLLSTTALTSGIYYVSQTIGVCESTRLPVSVLINPLANPIFTQIAPICSGTTINPLPTISPNGITGTWSPALNNNQTTTYTFTPDVGQCAVIATQIITVNPQITPTFTQIAPICLGTTINPLPTISTNGITGTWSPALNNNQTTTYTFTPDVGQCAVIATQTININSPKVTSPISFVAPPITVAALPSVTIGTQVWTNKNLDVSTYRDGTPIPQVTDPNQWANLTTGAWCYYNNDPANGEVYGKLYNLYAVAGIYDAASLNDPILRKQLAPIGWHVPSDGEWTGLINYLDSSASGGDNSSNIAGSKMKETGTLHWQSPNQDATNSNGFTGLPGGYCYYDGRFANIGDYGFWWSSSELDTSFAWYRYLYNYTSSAYRLNYYKTEGLSIRLIKD